MKAKSRIQQLFTDQKAFIGYLTAGDGGIDHTLDAAMALIAGGINMLEIGIPFSDPIADGPIIQRAATRALAHGTTLQDVLWLAAEIRKRSDIPLILFSYLNPILAALQTDFLLTAKEAGIDGLLLVDCPLEESHDIQQSCERHDIALIYVISSATSLTRIQQINAHASGFLYYACRKGTTGIRQTLPDDFPTQMKAIKDIVDYPVVVGFGISNRAMVEGVLAHADGAVVGSLFVKALEDGITLGNLSTLASTISPTR